jgi:uncharacterized cupin superfamily protein
MKRINIASPDFTYDEGDPEGYRAGMARLGKIFGAELTGVTAFDVPPGQAICPYHYECGEEEWLLVVAGKPTLRHPAGSESLKPWDVAFFPTGPKGAHKIGNETGETVRVLMFSNVVHPTATVYPDSDKVGVWTGDPEADVIVRRGSKVDYYDGEA